MSHDHDWEKNAKGDIKSKPPLGKKKITNWWWDPDTEEVVFDHD